MLAEAGDPACPWARCLPEPDPWRAPRVGDYNPRKENGANAIMASILQTSCPRWTRRPAAALGIFLASCQSPVPVVAPPEPPPQPPPGRALFLVENPAATNGSEKA